MNLPAIRDVHVCIVQAGHLLRLRLDQSMPWQFTQHTDTACGFGKLFLVTGVTAEKPGSASFGLSASELVEASKTVV
jgi:hypothetical protein